MIELNEFDKGRVAGFKQIYDNICSGEYNDLEDIKKSLRILLNGIEKVYNYKNIKKGGGK